MHVHVSQTSSASLIYHEQCSYAYNANHSKASSEAAVSSLVLWLFEALLILCIQGFILDQALPSYSGLLGYYILSDSYRSIIQPCSVQYEVFHKLACMSALHCIIADMLLLKGLWCQ